MPVGQVNNPQMKDLLDSEFQRSSDPSFLARIALSKYLNLPGLRGAWAAGVRFDTAYAGIAYITDQSGNGYHMETVHAPMMYTPLGRTYWAFDGANDYATYAADNAHFDVLATEAWTAYPGLSIGAWINTSRALPYANAEDIIAKWSAAAGNYAYLLSLDPVNSNNLTLHLCSNGVNWYAFDHSKTIARSTWYFTAATFNPGAVLNEAAGVRLWVNDAMQYHAASDRGVVGLPAAIFNSNQPLTFAAHGGINFFQGYQGYWWICGNYLLEGEIYNLYETTKYLFGFVNEKGTAW